MRVLAPLPAAAVDEAVSRFIDGRAGDGSGWAPTLVELKREADAIAGESGASTPDARDDAARMASIRQRLGDTPTFVGRHDPAWAEWQAHLLACGQPRPPPIQTINGFGNYFAAARPPSAKRSAG